MGVRFFYLPKGRRYNYEPRYYDPRMEDLERRKRIIDRELELEKGEESEDVYIPQIKGQIRKNVKSVNKQRKASSLRMFVILLFLLLITYILIKI